MARGHADGYPVRHVGQGRDTCPSRLGAGRILILDDYWLGGGVIAVAVGSFVARQINAHRSRHADHARRS